MNGYSFGLPLLYLVTYVVFFFLLPYFFTQRRPAFGKQAAFSMLSILVLIFAIEIITAFIPDQEIGNRILHALGGGFVAFLICLFAARDTGLRISKTRFLIFSFLLVTGLGVANELLEFLLQNITQVIYSPTTTDTWLDLLSNTIGILLGAACFLPYVAPHKEP